MGYRGKVEEQEKARALRARNHTLADIAQVLGVSKSSVSLWVRDVPFTPTLRLRGPHGRPHPAHEARLRQIADLNGEAKEAHRDALERGIPRFRSRSLLRRGSEGRWDRPVRKHGSHDDPVLLRLAAPILRRRRATPPSTRLSTPRPRLGACGDVLLDVDGRATEQFRLAHRAVPDASIRHNKHEHGCAYVYYSCSKTHREIMGLIRALLSSNSIPG